MNKVKDSARPERLYGKRTDAVFAVSGIVHVIRNEAELPYVREGEIIVAERICPEWTEQLSLAKAIIEDASAVDSVAENISAQYMLPATVEVSDAMALRSGDIVTMYGDGEVERICEKRAPDSPMRVAVPAAVAARTGHGIINAENVVLFGGGRQVSESNANNDANDQANDRAGETTNNNRDPASGE